MLGPCSFGISERSLDKRSLKHIEKLCRGNTRGLTLFEVVLVAAMLAVFVLAVSGAQLQSLSGTRQSEERAAAMRIAREKLEKMCAMRFDDVYTQYGPNGPYQYFDVVLDYSAASSSVLQGRCILPGLIRAGHMYPDAAGEVVIITDGSKSASSFGRDLSPLDGLPDGVNVAGLPLDLTGTGNTTDGNVWNPPNVVTGTCFPVGVVIRWQGVQGEERYELWTVLSRL